MHSPYARTGYTNETSVRERFEKAVNESTVQYNLLQPVCMYSEDEARMLFEEAGLTTTNLNRSNWSIYVTANCELT